MDRKSVISAYLQYSIVSIVIININLPGVTWWLQGSIIALALAIPIIIIVSDKDKKAVPVIALMSVVLGTLISFAGHYFK